eukprot:gene1335-1479_t
MKRFKNTVTAKCKENGHVITRNVSFFEKFRSAANGFDGDSDDEDDDDVVQPERIVDNRNIGNDDTQPRRPGRRIAQPERYGFNVPSSIIH